MAAATQDQTTVAPGVPAAPAAVPPGHAAGLDAVLDVRPMGDPTRQVFRGAAATGTSARMFGGHAMAQALLSAGHTVGDDLQPASLHCVLLRPGDAAVDCDLRVETVRDGRAFASRRTEVGQSGRLLADVTTQWHIGEQCSMSFDEVGTLPPLPPAQSLPYPAPGVATAAFDLRWADDGPDRVLWFRPEVPLPPERNVCAAVAVYLSDLWLADTALRRMGRRFDDRTVRASTLEHTVWFHGPVELAGWTCLRSTAVAARHGRALVTGDLRRADGQLIASVAQSVSVRDRPASSPAGPEPTASQEPTRSAP